MGERERESLDPQEDRSRGERGMGVAPHIGIVSGILCLRDGGRCPRAETAEIRSLITTLPPSITSNHLFVSSDEALVHSGALTYTTIHSNSSLFAVNPQFASGCLHGLRVWSHRVILSNLKSRIRNIVFITLQIVLNVLLYVVSWAYSFAATGTAIFCFVTIAHKSV